jgi:adenylate/nucleoside-diphosphate kinase
MESANTTPSKLIKYNLAPLNEIVPIGISCESVVTTLINNNC